MFWAVIVLLLLWCAICDGSLFVVFRKVWWVVTCIVNGIDYTWSLLEQGDSKEKMKEKES